MSRVNRFIFGVTALAAAFACVLLGRWQLRRLAARRTSNQAILAAQARPPMVLPGVVRLADSGRRAIARGRFDPAHQMLLRSRVQDDAPGLDVVTPFVLDSGEDVLWVVRGFVRSPDAVSPPDSIILPAPGDVTITGLLMAAPIARDSGSPLIHDRDTSWARVDRRALDRLQPRSLPVYLLLAADSRAIGRLPVAPPPELSNGPHLSYAIQWFGIALAVLTFWLLMSWRERRPRLGERLAP